jgi:hypothetical protein
MDLIWTKEQPHQEGFYWMARGGHEDYPGTYQMVEIMIVNDALWVTGNCLIESGFLKYFWNKLWAGPIPHPRKRDK